MAQEKYDYHFLLLAPGLQSAWFFQAGRRFWQRFQPVVTDSWEMIGYVPLDLTIAVTVLARPDTAIFIQQQIEAQRSDVRLDLVIAAELPMMESILNARAEAGLPFG